jgi:hypothetical protein
LLVLEVVGPTMNHIFISLAIVPLVLLPRSTTLASSQVSPTDVKSLEKESPLAEYTRSKLLKSKVGGAFKDVRLGDVLKELAAQVEMKCGQPVMWTYGVGFPFQKRVSITVKDLELNEALVLLFTEVGDGTGFVVVSNNGQNHDGWIRLTVGGERGKELPPPSQEEEAIARERLGLARKLLDSGMSASGKTLLRSLALKYARTKAGMEAIKLLKKLDP